MTFDLFVILFGQGKAPIRSGGPKSLRSRDNKHFVKYGNNSVIIGR